MGRFNFEDAGRKSNFGEFVPIEIKKRNEGYARIEKPILSMNSTTIRIGSFLGETLLDKGYKYARFMRSGSMLGIQFLHDEEDDCVTLRQAKNQGKAITAAFSSVSGYLMETTDLVNLNVYNYQFDVKHDEKNIYFIELDKPWRKTKKKKPHKD